MIDALLSFVTQSTFNEAFSRCSLLSIFIFTFQDFDPLQFIIEMLRAMQSAAHQ